MHGCTDGRSGGRIDGSMDGRTDRRTHSTHARMCLVAVAEVARCGEDVVAGDVDEDIELLAEDDGQLRLMLQG